MFKGQTFEADLKTKKPLGGGIFSTRSCLLSIVCAGVFHFRVRDGNGWFHLALTTKRLLRRVYYPIEALVTDARVYETRLAPNLVLLL